MKALVEDELNLVLNAFVSECAAEFTSALSEIILFGSYARGDFSDESDIDVLIILDTSYAEIGNFRKRVCRIASDLDLRFNVLISPVVKSKCDYETRKNTYGFCKNVNGEGIRKYAG